MYIGVLYGISSSGSSSSSTNTSTSSDSSSVSSTPPDMDSLPLDRMIYEPALKGHMSGLMAIAEQNGGTRYVVSIILHRITAQNEVGHAVEKGV